jgi:hypothetical protein
MATIPDTVLNGTHHRVDSYRYGSFSFANEEEDPYFVTNAKPDGLDIVKRKADEFIKFQCAKKRPVVLVTSGGSTVPLEVRNPVFGGGVANRGRIKRYDLSIISVLVHEEPVLVMTFKMTLTDS